MDTKRFLLMLASSSLLTFSVSAFGIMSVPYGWYLEGNFGGSKISNITYPGSSNTSGIGANANLGYKFMPFFALEAGFTAYANTTIEDNAGTKAATVKHYSYDIAAKGIVPITDSGFELFAKIGLGRPNARVTIDNTTAANNIGLSSSQHSATGLYLGIGGQYYFMPELAINIQWAQAQGSSSTGTLDLLSIGASFIFD